MPYDAFLASLDLLAERNLDPSERVYARLFADEQQVRELFVRDTDGSIRGAMMAQVIDSLLDFTGPRRWGHHLIASERVNHDGLGVPPELFGRFFGYLREACRELLGDAWTDEMERDWTRALDEVDALAA